MTRRFLAFVSGAALAAAPSAVRADEGCTSKPFDAAAAWAEVSSEMADNYSYWDMIDAQAAFDQASSAMRTAPDRLAFADRLETLLLLFRDSHLHVSPTSKPAIAWIPSAADMWFINAGGRLVVSDVKAGSVAAQRGVRPGWELVTIDGEDPRTTARKRFAAIGVTADAAQIIYAVNALGAGRIDRPRNVVLRDGSKRIALTLPAGYASVRRPREPLSVAHHTDARGHDVAVLRINNSLGEPALIAAFDQAVAVMPAASHVVIDLRDTPSGGTSTVARALMGHFVSEPKPYQRHELTVERVKSGVPRTWLEYVSPRASYRAAAPLVLAGRWTGSMGEGLAIGLNAAAGARIVGSQMGQLRGAIIQDDLPASCVTVSFANEKLWHVDGRRRESVMPDLTVPTADIARDGRDAALSLAIATLNADDGKMP